MMSMMSICFMTFFLYIVMGVGGLCVWGGGGGVGVRYRVLLLTQVTPEKKNNQGGFMP